MFGSNFIELGIALSFLFMLLSLMCSLLSETLSKHLSWRAEMLEESIRQLLRDADLAEHFYRHPVIKSLGREGRPFDKARLLDAASGDRWPRSWAKWLSRKADHATMPSYIKSTMFARVVLEVIVLMPRLELIKQLRAAIIQCKSLRGEEKPDAILADLKSAEFDNNEAFSAKNDAIGRLIAAKVKDEGDRAALLDLIEQLKAETPPAPSSANTVPAPAPAAEGQADAPPPSEAKPTALAEARAGLAKLKNGETRRVFESLIGGDEVTDIAKAYILIARYYDDVQERVSGWYKRRCQRTVFTLAIALAVILNANTLIIADKLLRDNSVRAIVVAAAEGNSERFRPRAEPVPEAGSTTPAAAGSGSPGASTAPAATVTLQDLKKEIDTLRLPTGWPERPAAIAMSVFPSTMGWMREVHGLCLQQASAQAVGKEAEEPSVAAAKAQLDRVKLAASVASLEAEKRSVEAAKALAEFDNNGRSCPDFLCGQRAWGTQWPYYLKKSVLWVLAMAVGWLVTALAAALGAQFWFDVLNKIMNIRTSKKPDEAS